MRRLQYVLLMSLILQLATYGQTFDVETIFKNGDNNKRINFVYLGDGYTSTELSNFITNATSATNEQFNFSPYKEYRNFFNAYAIKVISNESGANHPQTVGNSTCNAVPVLTVDNYFGSSFDRSNIHRLLVPGSYSKVNSVLAANTPYYDQANIIVNSPYYGGSGGSFATASTNSSSNMVMIHEIGHSFVRLGDEYWAGIAYANEKLNRTQESDPNAIKWKNWIGDRNVDVYPYGTSSPQSDWYRPHQNCAMRVLAKPFCAVCQEGTINKIYSLITPIENFSPVENAVSFTGDNLNFSIDLILPNPNTLTVEWFLDGTPIGANTNTITLTGTEITNNNHVLTVNVEDKTTLSRTHTNGYLFSLDWNITDNTLGIEDNTIAKFLYKVYPNPVKDILYFNYMALNVQDNFSLTVTDIQGKEVISRVFIPINGSNTQPIVVEKLSAGVYILSIKSTGYTKNFKFIKH